MADYQIFISYRRSGGEFLGKLLSDSLRKKGYRVFFDVEDMHSGMFNRQIQDVLSQISDVVLVLSAHALDKCTDENDWVRREIEWAMYCGKNIIPVLTRDFTWPEKDMPASIVNLRYYHGITVQNDTFDQSVDKLCNLLACRESAGAGGRGRKESFDSWEEMPETAPQEYYTIKTPFFTPFKSCKTRDTYGGELQLDADAAAHWQETGYKADPDKTFSEMFGRAWVEDMEKQAWFQGSEQEISLLRGKCLRLLQYTYPGRDNRPVHDIFFYKEFVLYMILMWEHSSAVRSRMSGIGDFCQVMTYIIDWDVFEAIDACRPAMKTLADYFQKYMFRPFESWPDILRVKGNDVRIGEKRSYSAYAIWLFDAMIDMYHLFFERWPEPEFEEFVKNKLLCSYKYLKKHQIFLPREVQRKVSEL